VQPIVDTVNGFIRTDMDTVWPITELPLTKRAQEVTITVEDHHRMLAPVKGVNVVLGVDSNPGDIDEFPSRWQLFPIFHRLEE
jgi:hypothetical protein